MRVVFQKRSRWGGIGALALAGVAILVYFNLWAGWTIMGRQSPWTSGVWRVGKAPAAVAAQRAAAEEEALDLSGWEPPTEEEIARRCVGTKGDWCGAFLRQRPIKWKPPPVGERTCLWDCESLPLRWLACAVGNT